ncbi:MAG: hypothetical protein H0V82_03600 [Candidatus Protochlamydia sp.]|nr:hypothetical protein [Candidatus Protochlamydia sp.]
MQFFLRGRDSLLNINQCIEEINRQQYKPIIAHLKNNFINNIRNFVNIAGKEEIIQQALDETFFGLSNINRSPLILLIQFEKSLLKIIGLEISAFSFLPKNIFPTQFIKQNQSYRFDYLEEWALRDATSLKMAISNFLAAEENQMLRDNWDGLIGHEITNMPKVLKFLKADKKKGHIYAGIVMKEVGPSWEIWDEDILCCITKYLPKEPFIKNYGPYRICESQRSLSNLKLVSRSFNNKINIMISNLFIARLDNKAVEENEVENFIEFGAKFKNVYLVINKYSDKFFQHLIKKDIPHISQLKIRFDAGEYMTLKVMKSLSSKLRKVDLFCDFTKPAMSKLINHLDLANNNTLKKLVLRAPGMKNNQFVQLGESLEKNTTLEKLQLRSGSLSLDDDFPLLLKNNSIKELKIVMDKDMQMEMEVVFEKILDAFKTNMKLINFTIMPILNKFDYDHYYDNNPSLYSDMIDSLHRNEYLDKINIDEHEIEGAFYEQLAKIEPFLERNREIAEKI